MATANKRTKWLWTAVLALGIGAGWHLSQMGFARNEMGDSSDASATPAAPSKTAANPEHWNGKLPPGHPDVSQLPPGHPDIGQMPGIIPPTESGADCPYLTKQRPARDKT